MNNKLLRYYYMSEGSQQMIKGEFEFQRLATEVCEVPGVFEAVGVFVKFGVAVKIVTPEAEETALGGFAGFEMLGTFAG